jgi:hypothetical protein
MTLVATIVTVGIVIESTSKTSYAQFIIGKLIVYLGGGIVRAAARPPTMRKALYVPDIKPRKDTGAHSPW